jgi:Protein of unknown function (DUF3396)
MTNVLIFEKDGMEYMKLCVDITVYWTGSVFGRKHAILLAYSNALDVVGTALKHYATGSMPRFRPIDRTTFKLLPEWLNTADPREDTEYILKFESHPTPNMYSDTALFLWAIEYRNREVGAIRLVLPISTINGSSDTLHHLAVAILSPLDFHSGHSGYAINWSYLGRYASASRQAMRMLARRFPGIDLPHPLSTLMAIPSGIKRINWLTFLGTPIVERLGGQDQVNKILTQSDIRVQQLDHGIVIIAGKQPGLGDVNRREALDAYHTVGRFLAPFRSHRHPPFLGGPEDEERTAEWLSHFDN